MLRQCLACSCVVLLSYLTFFTNGKAVASKDRRRLASPQLISIVTPTQSCLPNNTIPGSYIPFTEVSYISAANANGDRLVVGSSTIQNLQTLRALPVPSTINQRFCEPVQLGPNLFAIAYVPNAQERNGDFSSFAGIFIDPLANQPFPGGFIPANRLGGILAWRIANIVSALASVSAASYSGTSLASESLVTLFGTSLANETTTANSLPLPTTLADVSVKVRDSAGIERLAPLFFVSPTQINCQLPAGTMNGRATLTVTRNNATVGFGTAAITALAPALFAANANGQGIAAAVVLRIRDGVPSYEPVARYDTMQSRFVAAPIDLGPETDQVFLLLFGTGLRFRSSLAAVSATIGNLAAQVSYAGAQGDLIGLDQINLALPRSLSGRGEVNLALTVDGQAANTVTISFR